MAEVITVPRLSDTMTEGKVAKWHKKVGDDVKEGDILAEIETDKAVQDFETEYSGKLLYIGVAEGEAAPVDSVLAIIGKEGEDISKLKGERVDAGISEKVEEQAIDQEHQTLGEATSIEQAKNVEIPKGVEVINIPRLSDTMTEGKVAKWHKNIGDAVKEGDIIAEIETDKAVQDFESEYNGVLLYQGVSEGNSAPVDQILAIIGPAGTDVSAIVSNGGNASVSTAIAEKPSVESTNTVSNNSNVVVNSSSEKIIISPLAKKMAQEKGIDISTVKGSGENGRIVKKDIENYSSTASNTNAVSAVSTAAAVGTAAAVVAGSTSNSVSANQNAQSSKTDANQIAPKTIAANIIEGKDTETPNSQVRNIIAKRLSESKNTAPHYYLMVEISMDNAIQARAEINSMPDTKVSFNDMIIKAVALSLRYHPQVNSSWAEDKIIHHGNINIGVAVAIPDGLVVPVLKNADQLNFNQISTSIKDMATRAKNKTLKANEMEGSTFSISNLGMYGIETFTSIINQPNSCILSVGSIIEKPVVKNGQIVVGNTMKLSLACDHRVVDGATGAEFLQTLRGYLEKPLTLFM